MKWVEYMHSFSFVFKHKNGLHEEVKSNLHNSNQGYKYKAYKKKIYKNFEVGYEITIHLKKNRFELAHIVS